MNGIGMFGFDEFIKRALEEDMGTGDITTNSTVSEDAEISGEYIAKDNGVLCGTFAVRRVFEIVGGDTKLEFYAKDGDIVKKGEVIGRVSGNARSVLMGERLGLNLMQHMSGIATCTKKYVDAVAGTNAGGFYDPNGQGTGGIPDGIVIYENELLWGSLDEYYSIAGLDNDGILHVGVMTGRQALDRNIKYAASYGPALVINGKYAGGTWGLGGGLNPRTAIGQRADGAILLLVINGRSIESLGATLDDLAGIMLEHGAVNATNLDGGSSSIMIMNGEYLTSSAYIFGERVVATAILVK